MGCIDECIEGFSALFFTQLHIVSLPLKKQGKTVFGCFGAIGVSEGWDSRALRCWRLDGVYWLIRSTSMRTEIFRGDGAILAVRPQVR